MSILKYIKAITSKGRFLWDVLALAGGTAIGQLFIILASPLLTRLYTPTDFGLLAVFTSTLGILSVVASLRYEFAIPIAKSEEEARSLLALSLLLVILSSILVTIVIIFWGSALTQWGNTPQLSSYLWMLPIGLAAYGAFQAINYWYTRTQRFTPLGVSKTLQSAGQVIFQILAGVSFLGTLGLIAGQVIGRLISTLFLFSKLDLRLREVSIKGIQTVSIIYKKFPLYTAPASLVNVIGTQAPAIMFAKMFSTESAGLFSLTIRVLSLPAALIGQAIGQAIYPRLAARNSETGGASELIGNTAMILLLIAFPVFVFTGAYGPSLFVVVFGKEWHDAGLYASYLSPWLLLAFVSSPLSMFVFVKERQGLAFLITLYETALRIGSIWIGKFIGSPDSSVALFSIAGMIISIIYLVWIFHMSEQSIVKWISIKKEYLLSAVIILIIILVIARNDGIFSMCISLLILLIHFLYSINKYGKILYV